MLHGSGPGASGWANFNRNVEPFVAAGYRVVLMDCPGWSKSDPVVCTGSRSDLNARALKGLMDAIGLDKAHIIGNSMGGHSAVAFALANPARVGKLVLMGGGTGGVSPFVPMPTEGIKLIGALYRDPTIENLKRMMNVFVYDTSNLTEELFRARLDNMLSRRDHLENFVKSAEANPKQFPDVGHRLGEIAAPTLVIWGRDDRFVPLDMGLRLWPVAERRAARLQPLRPLGAVGARRQVQPHGAGLPGALTRRTRQVIPPNRAPQSGQLPIAY